MNHRFTLRTHGKCNGKLKPGTIYRFKVKIVIVEQ